MTDKYTKIVIWANLVLTLGIVAFIAFAGKTGNPALGAAGNMLAENYIPYVMYNGGYNSAKDFTISGSTSFTGSSVFASTTITDLKIGQVGTKLSRALTGTCTLQGANLSIPATTTTLFSCPVTGVVSSDQVFVSLGTTTRVAGQGQFLLASAIASSTADFIEIGITNLTGIAASPASAGNASTGFASTTQYWIVRD